MGADIRLVNSRSMVLGRSLYQVLFTQGRTIGLQMWASFKCILFCLVSREGDPYMTVPSLYQAVVLSCLSLWTVRFGVPTQI